MDILLWVLFTVYVVCDIIHHLFIRKDIRVLRDNSMLLNDSINTTSVRIQQMEDIVEEVVEYLSDDMEQNKIMRGE